MHLNVFSFHASDLGTVNDESVFNDVYKSMMFTKASTPMNYN